MKIIAISIMLMLGVGSLRAAVPEFPITPVNNYETLKAWFKDAPHTVASFKMTRTMRSGRLLNSRGTFECRRGVGMMWRMEHPVRNAMIISRDTLKLYDARGRELRRTDLSAGPAARFTQAFMQELSPDFIRQLERLFELTCRSEADASRLIVGLKARNQSMDLQWIILVANNKGELMAVYYESLRQGRTSVEFHDVRYADALPDSDFEIVAR